MPGDVFSLSVDSLVSTKISNFPEDVYSFNKTDNLTALMNVLLGDAGVGQLTRLQTAASNNQNVSGMEFSDLDNIIGKILNSSRLSNEQYEQAVNPFKDQLLRSTWDNVLSADAAYRERLSLMLTAINSGATVLGLTLLCEAILGHSVRIIEAWRAPFSGGTFYYPTIGNVPSFNNPENPVGSPTSSMLNTNSITEFLIVPKGESSYSQDIIQSLADLVKLLKPENSIASFYVPNQTYMVDYGSGVSTLVFSNGIAPRASDLYCIITGVGIPVGTYITNIESLSSTYSGTISVTISNATTASGSSITLDPSQFEIPLSSKQIVSNSEWFEYDVLAAIGGITKTGISELSQFPDRYWLNPGQMIQAPIFAHLTSTEEEIDVTSLVSNIEMVYYPSPDSINFPAPPPPPTPTPPPVPVPAPNNSSSLYAINQLTINQSLTSPNGRYFAIMQGDGNFVVYDKTPNSVITVPSQTLSYSGTDYDVPNYGSTGANVKILQNDLNLIAGAGLVVDGLYGVRTRQAVTNFQRFFKITIDGECGPQTWGVILYVLSLKSPQGNKAIWSTKTPGSGANRAVVQGDGNFVLYTPANKAVWASGSKGQSVVLTMQDDSNLVLYETSGANKWQWFGFPYAVWSWWTGSVAEDPGYNAFLATTNKPPPTLPPVQPPPPPVIVYGEWVEIGKSDSADNFPNGMYPADVNHYLTYNLHYTGSQSSLQNLTELNLNSVASIPAASNIVPGISSLMTSNGVVHVFGYTGVDTVNKKLTGCSFDGKITDVLLNNGAVTVFGNYNFEWSSQKEYTDYIVNMVKKLNGQFDNSTNPTKYRLPVSGAFWNKQDPEEVVPLSKILAPLSAQVVSTVYGGI